MFQITKKLSERIEERTSNYELVYTTEEVDIECGCTGNCGQSCSGGCDSGCTGGCGRSCAGTAS